MGATHRSHSRAASAAAVRRAPATVTLRTPEWSMSAPPSSDPPAMPTLKAEPLPAEAMSVLPGATCSARLAMAAASALNDMPVTQRATTATGCRAPKTYRVSSAHVMRASGPTRAVLGRLSSSRPTTMVPATPAIPDARSSGLSAAGAKPPKSSRNGVM